MKVNIKMITPPQWVCISHIHTDGRGVIDSYNVNTVASLLTKGLVARRGRKEFVLTPVGVAMVEHVRELRAAAVKEYKEYRASLTKAKRNG